MFLFPKCEKFPLKLQFYEFSDIFYLWNKFLKWEIQISVEIETSIVKTSDAAAGPLDGLRRG